LKGTRNLALSPDLRIPSGDAGAFRSTLDTGETTVVLCTASEVSDALSATLSVDRALVVPISNGSRNAALLVASAAEHMDTNALELIAQIASAALERRSQITPHVQIEPAPPKPDPIDGEAKNGTRPESELAPWTRLPNPEKLLHVRAQRLARVKVAEMQLYRPEACQAGRAQSNLYLFLKPEIDSARELFRNQFMSATSMADYLHLELLRQLAENNEAFLGADYPGQMV
jgi:hypothetical protein